MKRLSLLLCTLYLLVPTLGFSSIVVDQFGYIIDGRKVAIFKEAHIGSDAGGTQGRPGSIFLLKNLETEEIVFEGAVREWNNGAVHEQSGDKIWYMDFSEFNQPGLYRIEDPVSGQKSHPFEIRENPYKNVLKAALRTFFYQRSGFAKEARFAGENWADDAAHLQDKETRDFFDQNNQNRFKNLYGGWFDAGDYNKYVTFASGAVHPLLAAYRLNPKIWGDDYNIPESGNGLPDILDELKWEVDWLLRMQVEDGGVIIKMGAREYYGASPPSTDNRDRYYGRVSTSSTIAFASMAAHAALIYREFPEWEEFAITLEAAAVRAWEYFSASETLDTDSDQGEIKAGDADRSRESQLSEEAIFGIYMFALTGELKWNNLFSERYTELPLPGWWGPYDNYIGEALLFYTTLEGVSESINNDIVNSFRAKPSPFYGTSDHIDPYSVGMPDSQYHWGSLSVMAKVGILNLNVMRYLDEANPDMYRQRAEDILHYIHGRNPLDKSYLSNMYTYGAENPVNEFYHGWFEHGSVWQNALTSEKGGPAPGFLVGGPNQAYSGQENPYLELNQPPQKMYADFNDTAEWPVQYNPWEITENSIGYQAAYVRLLSEFVSMSNNTIEFEAPIPEGPGNGGSDEEIPGEYRLDQNYPNPFNPSTKISFALPRASSVSLDVYNLYGQKVAELIHGIVHGGMHTVEFYAGGLSSGIYFYKLQAGDFSENRKMLFIK